MAMRHLAIALLVLSGCATAPVTKDGWRDAIYARHASCQQRAQAEQMRGQGQNAMALFWCDRQEDVECRAHGLEARCAEWQWPN